MFPHTEAEEEGNRDEESEKAHLEAIKFQTFMRIEEYCTLQDILGTFFICILTSFFVILPFSLSGFSDYNSFMAGAFLPILFGIVYILTVSFKTIRIFEHITHNISDFPYFSIFWVFFFFLAHFVIFLAILLFVLSSSSSSSFPVSFEEIDFWNNSHFFLIVSYELCFFSHFFFATFLKRVFHLNALVFNQYAVLISLLSFNFFSFPPLIMVCLLSSFFVSILCFFVSYIFPQRRFLATWLFSSSSVMIILSLFLFPLLSPASFDILLMCAVLSSLLLIALLSVLVSSTLPLLLSLICFSYHLSIFFLNNPLFFSFFLFLSVSLTVIGILSPIFLRLRVNLRLKFETFAPYLPILELVSVLLFHLESPRLASENEGAHDGEIPHHYSTTDHDSPSLLSTSLSQLSQTPNVVDLEHQEPPCLTEEEDRGDGHFDEGQSEITCEDTQDH